MSSVMAKKNLDWVPLHGLFVSVNSHGTIIEAGDQCVSITGYRAVELIGCSVQTFVHPGFVGIMEGILQQGFVGKSAIVDCAIITKSGDIQNLKVLYSGNIVDGSLLSLNLFVRNENTLFVERSRIPNLIVQHLPLPVILYDIVRALENENSSYVASIAWGGRNGSRVLHVETPRMPQRPVFQPFRRDTRPVHCLPAKEHGGSVNLTDISTHTECQTCHWLSQESGHTTCWSRVLKTSEGHILGKLSVHGQQTFNDDAVAILESYASLAELAILSNEYERRILIRRVEHDDLTGLFNFNKFYSTLTMRDMNAKVTSLFYINLDNFKFLNDSVGIVMGNQILIQVANVIRDWCGSTRVAARLAGNEFGVILLESTAVDAVKTAKQLLTVLREPIELGKDIVHLTASIGVSTGKKADKLIHNASQGSKEAKAMGGDAVLYFDEECDRDGFRTLALLHDIRLALELDQLDVHYQPRVNPVTNDIVATEALLRWTHPNWGVVPPNEFIGALEQQGCMARVGEWVVKRVCRDLGNWSKLGINLVPVSVNFSPHQLLRPSFVEYVTSTLLEYKINPQFIQIEMTERLAVQRENLIVAVVNELRECGIQVLIDDFGVGNTSLSYLRKLKVHAIKLDKELIKHMVDNVRDTSIIASIVDLAHRIGVRVIVEGVEIPDQVTRLKELKCDEVQGYLFSRAIPATQFATLLQKRRISPATNINYS